MNKSRLLGAVCACSLSLASFILASNASSATVWAPTNEDTDFIQLEFLGLTTNGGSLTLFDEDDFGGNALDIGSSGGEVRFTSSGSDWTAQFFDVNNTPGGTITLVGDTNFVLGMKWEDGDYWADSTWSLESSPDTYLITFTGLDVPNSPDIGQTLAVDVTVVPIPAAVWLFGSGLIGLAGIARRSKTV